MIVVVIRDLYFQDDVHNALATVVRNCKNFKVRINAAMAFSVPVKRENFGSTQTFVGVWDSLLGGLQGSETVNDFMEYKYRDSLLEQVSFIIMIGHCNISYTYMVIR